LKIDRGGSVIAAVTRLKTMECISTLGGPQVLLPTRDVDRWIDQLGDEKPVPDSGLYGLACTVNDYCGIISPWGTPLLVFGDILGDIYWFPQLGDGLFARWIAAETHDDFVDFVSRELHTDDWPHSTQWLIGDSDLTLMDTCTFPGDDRFRLRLDLNPGTATVYSRYASDDANMCVLHRIQRGG
jgi:hypothetical protein